MVFMKSLFCLGLRAFWGCLEALCALFCLFLGAVYLDLNNASAMECKQALADTAREAASGMDMSSIMMMTTVTQGVTSNLEGKSARYAHMGNAGIQGTLAGIATKRYVECSAAIKTCETTCESFATQNCTGGPPREASNCENNKSTAQEVLEQCQAEESACSEAALQALISAISAAISFMAMKQLGEGNGGGPNPEKWAKCLENHSFKECCQRYPSHPGCGSPPTPRTPNPSAPSPELSPAPVSGDETGPRAAAPPPLGHPAPDGEEKRDPQPSAPGPEEDPNELLAGPGGAGPSSAPGSGFNYGDSGGSGSASNSGGGSGGSEGLEDEYADYLEEDEGRALRAGLSGTFAGGIPGGPGAAAPGRAGPSRGGRGLNSSASGKKGKAAVKRNIFSKKAGAGGPETIFQKMSRVIQSFCSEGQKCFSKGGKAFTTGKGKALKKPKF